MLDLLHVFVLVLMWGNVAGLSLTARCSTVRGSTRSEVRVCRCNPIKRIDCGPNRHIIVGDILFGSSNASSCTSDGNCSMGSLCEYKLSEHCNDQQFHEVLQACSGQQACIIHTNGHRVCSRDYSEKHTLVKYSCENDYDRPRFDVCGVNASMSFRRDAYLTSPSLPSTHFPSQERLCCCSLTGVRAFYVLFYNSRGTAGSRITFGENTTEGFQTVDFQNKVQDVRISYLNRNKKYYFTWQLDGKGNSGTFIAWIEGNGKGYNAVTCGSTECPPPPTPITSPTTRRSSVTTYGKLVSTSLSALVSDPTITIDLISGIRARDDENGEQYRIGMYASIGVACSVAIAAAIVTAFVVIRRRRATTESREYMTPSTAVSPNAPNIYTTLDLPAANTAYEEVADVASTPIGDAPADSKQDTPTRLDDTRKTGGRRSRNVYENVGYKPYENVDIT